MTAYYPQQQVISPQYSGVGYSSPYAQPAYTGAARMRPIRRRSSFTYGEGDYEDREKEERRARKLYKEERKEERKEREERRSEERKALKQFRRENRHDFERGYAEQAVLGAVTGGRVVAPQYAQGVTYPQVQYVQAGQQQQQPYYGAGTTRGTVIVQPPVGAQSYQTAGGYQTLGTTGGQQYAYAQPQYAYAQPQYAATTGQQYATTTGQQYAYAQPQYAATTGQQYATTTGQQYAVANTGVGYGGVTGAYAQQPQYVQAGSQMVYPQQTGMGIPHQQQQQVMYARPRALSVGVGGQQYIR